MSGYIKDYRKELNSDIWKMPPVYYRLWQYLKYTVNHAPAKIPQAGGGFIEIGIGQTLTSYRNLAAGISWYEGATLKTPSPNTIKKVLSWLEINEMIEIEGKEQGKRRQYTKIKVKNFHMYQSGIFTNRGNTQESVETVGTQGAQEPVYADLEQQMNSDRYSDDKQTRRTKKNKEKEPLQESNFFINKYSAKQKEIINKYWQVVRTTRKNNKVADSVISKNMKKWEKYNSDIVMYALQIHIEKYPDKREEYTQGIIRRADSEGIPKQEEATKQPGSIDLNNLFND